MRCRRQAWNILRIRLPLLALASGLNCPAMAQDPAAVGTEAAPVIKDPETELLLGLHDAHAEFSSLFDSLPRDSSNRVDWEKAKAAGLINPSPTIDGANVEEKIFDLRVVIEFDDLLVKNVVFSHAIHTYWLD